MEGPIRGEEPGDSDPEPHEAFGWWNEIHGIDGFGLDDLDDLDDADVVGHTTADALSTAPLPLPPDDRLWRHPSELSLIQEDPPAPASNNRLLIGVALATGLIGAVIGAGAILAFGSGTDRVVETVVERELAEPVARFASNSVNTVDVVAIADRARPSIVRVEIQDADDRLVRSGSGVVFRDDGHILTNAHVVEGASTIQVVTYDGRIISADLVGADTLTDIAVLKVDASNGLVPVVLGSTTETRVGEPAVAIGSPLRLEGGPTVTVGVVSAIGRSLQRQDSGRLYDLVQTDAPISPGSSGGALLDGDGALIGITTVIAVSDVGAEGLGFATPVEIARDVAVDLITDGRALHGFLGVGGEDLPADRASELGVAGGSVVTSVGEDTPAAQAGLASGDVIVSIDGTPVENMSALVVQIRRADPGQTIQIGIVREGTMLTVAAQLTERP
ncbi:MAG: trypsin-like peptidase domain-containing protein [Acidimicrobiales bacterium]